MSRLLILCIFNLTYIGAVAQGRDENTGEIEEKQFVIEKNKEIVLPEYPKISEKAPIVPFDNQTMEVGYDIRDIKTALPDMNTSMKMATLKPEPVAVILPGYIKAGIGNYATSYFDAYWSTGRKENHLLGVQVKHLASQNGPVENSGNSENKMIGHGAYFFKNSTLKGSIGYSRLRNNFYGYAAGAEVKEDSIRQVYQYLGANISLANSRKDADMDYEVRTGISLLNDRFDASEVLSNTGIRGRYKLTETIGIHLESDLIISNRRDSLEQSRNLLRFKPYASLIYEGIRFLAGFNMVYDGDTIRDNEGVHYYPFLRAEYSLENIGLNLFAQLEGNMEFNSLHSLSRQNQFIEKQIQLANTNKKIDFSGGLTGNLHNRLQYTAGFSFATLQYLQLFVNNPSDSSRFLSVYDDGNTTRTNFFIGGDLLFIDHFRAGIRMDLFSYNTSKVDRAFHLPTTIVRTYATYNLKDKIHFYGDFQVMSGITALKPDNTVVTLDMIPDLSLKADYLFSKRFSAFIQMNNVLAIKYQRYLYYPVRSFNVLAGITFSF